MTNQSKFFPLTGVPPRQFNLGDRVQTTSFNDISDEEYLFESTVFGYQYQHPLWLNDSDSIRKEYEGWVYMVATTYESGEQILAYPYIHYYEENRLSLIEGIDSPEIVLDYEMIWNLFGGNWSLLTLLKHCQVTIIGNPQGTQFVVKTPPDLADYWGENYARLQNALGAINLTQDVKVKLI